HGHSGERRTDETDIAREFSSFNAAMERVIAAPGSSWRVRHIYNITTLDRLDAIERRLDDTRSADGFEMRAFSQRDAIPQLATLIVGTEDVFMAIDDPGYYRVQKAIHLRSRDAVDVVNQ